MDPEFEKIASSHAALAANIATQTASATAKAVTEAAQAAAKVLASENGVVVTAIALLRADVVLLKDQVGKNGVTVEKLDARLDDVALGRPSWSVALILGGMTSLIVGLVVFIATKI